LRAYNSIQNPSWQTKAKKSWKILSWGLKMI